MQRFFSLFAPFFFVLSSGYAQQAEVIDLSAGGFAPPFTAYSINDASAVVVRAGNGAYVWRDGTPQPITVSTYPAPLKLNNNGVVLGLSWNGDPPRAFVWDGAAAQVLDYAPVVFFWGINNSNTFALGSALWQWSSESAALTQTLPGARDINDRGEILAREVDPEGVLRGVIVRGDAREYFGDPGTSPCALSNTGVVIGDVFDSGVHTTSFYYAEGRLQPLTAPEPFAGWVPHVNELNDAGAVVGAVYPPTYDPAVVSRAVLWQNGTAVDLNSFLPAGSPWMLSEAYGINARGEIVGMGLLREELRPFLLRFRDDPGSVAPVTGSTPAPGSTPVDLAPPACGGSPCADSTPTEGAAAVPTPSATGDNQAVNVSAERLPAPLITPSGRRSVYVTMRDIERARYLVTVRSPDGAMLRKTVFRSTMRLSGLQPGTYVVRYRVTGGTAARGFAVSAPARFRI